MPQNQLGCTMATKPLFGLNSTPAVYNRCAGLGSDALAYKKGSESAGSNNLI